MLNRYSFQMIDDSDSWPWMVPLLPAIMPLFAVTREEAIFSGSCFVVSAGGEFVTARHVAEELRDLHESAHGEATVAALCNSPTKGGLIKVTGFSMSPDDNVTSDLACGHLDLDTQWGGPIELPFLKVSPEPAAIGEDMTAIGHAHLPKKVFIGANGAFEMTAEFTMVHEPVAKVHDIAPNLHSPTFELARTMPGGMSGGPIFRQSTGEVAGVCAYGLAGNSGEHEPYCYGSQLQPLWEPFGRGEQ